MRLKDKVAIVTGAASGIGKEIAIIFAREGAKVAIADLDQKAADATASEIDPTGKRVVGVAMDVANEQQVDDGTARVVETFGSLDVLISNAGIQIVAPIVDFEFAKWKRLMAIHLDGAFLTTRAALRQMYRQKSGSIVYMGSVHSKEASVLKAPYVTAKHGLIGLAKVVAKEGAAHGVRANVSPHPSGRQANTGASQGTRHLGTGSHQEYHAERNRGRRIYDGRRRGRDRAVSGFFRFECPDRPVYCRESWVVHAIAIT